ncbi:UNVERIFIED_CONTAM: hypothetical protein FKN15_062886 [Acipenser sinensis]
MCNYVPSPQQFPTQLRRTEDPMTKPISSFTPRNSRADVSELPASVGHRPALQVSA